MTRSRTAVVNDDIPATDTSYPAASDSGSDSLSSGSETSSRHRRITDTTIFRHPLRQSDTANIPDIDHSSLPRFSGKSKRQRRHAPYPSERPTVNVGDALSNDQRRRIRAWKDIARKKETKDKEPTSEWQRLVMVMVFNEITAYPPEDWLSLIGGLINRSTAQVDTFFSNTRQKLKRIAGNDHPPDHVRDSRTVDVGKDRPVKMRRSALELCPAENWTDSFIEEIVMIYNFRASGYLRRKAAVGANT